MSKNLFKRKFRSALAASLGALSFSSSTFVVNAGEIKGVEDISNYLGEEFDLCSGVKLDASTVGKENGSYREAISELNKRLEHKGLFIPVGGTIGSPSGLRIRICKSGVSDAVDAVLKSMGDGDFIYLVKAGTSPSDDLIKGKNKVYADAFAKFTWLSDAKRTIESLKDSYHNKELECVSLKEEVGVLEARSDELLEKTKEYKDDKKREEFENSKSDYENSKKSIALLKEEETGLLDKLKTLNKKLKSNETKSLNKETLFSYFNGIYGKDILEFKEIGPKYEVLKSDFDKKSSELKALKNLLSSERNSIKKLEAEKNFLNGSISNIKKGLGKISSDSIKKSLNELNEEKKGFEEGIEDINTEITRYDNILNSKEIKVKTGEEITQKEIEEKKGEEITQKEIEEKKELLVKKRKKVNNIDAMILKTSEMLGEVLGKEKELEKNNKRLDKIDLLLKSKNEKVKLSEDKLTNVESEEKELEKSLLEVESEYKLAYSKYNTAVKKIKKFLEELGVSKNNVTNISSEIKKVEKLLEECRQKMENKRSAFKGIVDKYNASRKDFEVSSDIKSAVEGKIKEYKSDILEKNEKVGEIDSYIKNFNEQSIINFLNKCDEDQKGQNRGWTDNKVLKGLALGGAGLATVGIPSYFIYNHYAQENKQEDEADNLASEVVSPENGGDNISTENQSGN
jgi:chromosome segregation ATPase